MDLSKLAAILSASRSSRRYELACPACGSRELSGDWRPVDGEHEAFNYQCAACGAVHGDLAALVRVG